MNYSHQYGRGVSIRFLTVTARGSHAAVGGVFVCKQSGIVCVSGASEYE